MRIEYTKQSLESLADLLLFLSEIQGLPEKKVSEIKEQLFARVESLAFNPHLGQLEPYLSHLNLSHRRLVEGHIKIIYRIGEKVIYVTDFFDSRQDLSKMKG